MAHPQARQALMAFEHAERTRWRAEMAEARLARALVQVPDDDMDWYVQQSDELANNLDEYYSQRPEMRWMRQHEEALMRAAMRKAREQVAQK